MMRQIAGAFAEYEKARVVAKLKSARDRKRQATGKCEGRLSRIERLVRGEQRGPKAEAMPADPVAAAKIEEAIAIAKRLRRANPKTGERRSLRKIAAELAALGHVNERGRLYSAKSVRAMLSNSGGPSFGKGHWFCNPLRVCAVGSRG